MTLATIKMFHCTCWRSRKEGLKEDKIYQTDLLILLRTNCISVVMIRYQEY